MVKMAGLDPHPRALLSCRSVNLITLGQTQPIVPLIGLTVSGERAFKHENFGPARIAQFSERASVPLFENHALELIFVKLGLPHPGLDLLKLKRVEIEAELIAIIRVELPQFDEDRAAIVGAWNVMGGRRIADIGARRIIAMLILEGPFEDDELLTASMGVLGKSAALGVADDRGRPRHFIADPIEHPPVDAFHRRRHPGELAGVDRCPL